MKSILSVAFVLACVCPSDAQILTTQRRLDDGRTEIKIKNNSAVAVTAFAISAKLITANREARNTAADSLFLAYDDPAIDSSMELLPSQERVLPPVGIMCGPVVKQSSNDSLRDAGRARADRQYRRSLICELEQATIAAVFADGSTTGDATLLTRLLFPSKQHAARNRHDH